MTPPARRATWSAAGTARRPRGRADGRAGARCPRSTTACSPGCASTTSPTARSPTRPSSVRGRPPLESLDAVATVIGHCEPQDVVANRLDPWHGAWLHPYSFTALKRLSAPPLSCPPAEDPVLVEVTFTIGKRLGVPVHAAFNSPDPRTVTMEIVDGEGTGSVVETHATPLRPDAAGRPRTAVIEAVVAYSDRPGFAMTLSGRGRAATAGRPHRRPALARRHRLRRAAARPAGYSSVGLIFRSGPTAGVERLPISPSEERVHDVLLPAGVRLHAHVDEAGGVHAGGERLDAVEVQHAAPQVAVQIGKAGAGACPSG